MCVFLRRYSPRSTPGHRVVGIAVLYYFSLVVLVFVQNSLKVIYRLLSYPSCRREATVQAWLPQGPESLPRPERFPAARWPPMGARLGLPFPPLPQERPLRRLLLVLEVVDAPSFPFPRSSSSSSSMLNRPCSSSILSRLILLLLTARSMPRRPLELPMLDPEVTRVTPGWMGLLESAASSDARDDSRVRDNCWLIMLMEACRGGEEMNGFAWSLVGRETARRDGLAPGCRLEFRRGEPTWPNAEAPGSEPDSNPPSCDGRDLPHRDWKREGDDATPEGDPILTSEAVGEAPSLESEFLCESEFPSLSP